MQTSAGGDLAGPATPDLKQRVAGGIARGATVIAALTIVARLFGLIRTLVFSQTVGAGCLGTAYVTANQVPNLVYELVLGGAMTSAMVPILARAAERADSDPAERAYVGQITSAMLTWSVAILVPSTLVIIAMATPIAILLNPANPSEHCVRADMINATSHMLVVFAPQILLYGLSVVLYGLLQAYRRFAGPTLGPAISSLVVIAACLAFVPLSDGQPLGSLPLSAELVLSVGTTLGVAALVVAGIVPTWRLHLRFRPAWRFPPGVARRAGGLALCGLAEIVVVDLASVVAIALANGHGTTGTIVIFNYATQVFNSVSAVLAISVVLSAFPVLSARDGPEFDRTSAGSTRAVLLLSWLGTAAIVAIALPAGRVLASQPDQVPALVAVVCPVRARGGRLRRDREPVPGDVRHRPAEGRGRGPGRLLAADDRGRCRAGAAGAAAPRGGRAGGGEHRRPDRRRDPAGARHPPDLRPGRRPGVRPRHAGRAGGRGRRRRPGRGRLPGRAGRREARLGRRGGGRGRCRASSRFGVVAYLLDRAT